MNNPSAAPLLYRLPANAHRPCDIQVFSDRVSFSGRFWYLRDKDFYSNRGRSEAALIRDFQGMGYLEKRSYRRTLLFVFGASLLAAVKAVVDKLGEWLDEANGYLQWFHQSLSLPDWVDTGVNVLVILCVILAIALFFSKKKVIEISFTGKRICIPQKSLSTAEFQNLYQIIRSQKV